VNITHFLLPNTPADIEKLKAFALSYSKSIDAGLPTATSDAIGRAFLDNLKTLVDEKPTEKYYIHRKSTDKRSESYFRDYDSYDAAANVLRAAYPSHSDNSWKTSYDIRPVSGEQAYQDFLNQPILASGGWSAPASQAYTWPFPYEAPKLYEIYHTGTNRPAAFFKGRVYRSREEADRDIRHMHSTTTGTHRLSDWLMTYEARIKR
jgi:hypothetical protein